jgi:hypothetical protein
MSAKESLFPSRDGQRDFDFIIGDWNVHLKKLENPLTGSSSWIEYRGTSHIRKIWDDCANTEEFDVDSPERHLHIRNQTLRMYSPDTRQWSIYLVNAAKGIISLPPVVGHFDGLGRGEFYDGEEWKGRYIFVRYVWLDVKPGEARMEQSFSADGGKTWEMNWICTLTR